MLEKLPVFLNRINGYTDQIIRYKGFFKKAIRLFKLKNRTPLTYLDNEGNLYQPNKCYETDWGSTPSALQLFLPKERYVGYLFHDSAYTLHKNGKHGLFVSKVNIDYARLVMSTNNEKMAAKVILEAAKKFEFVEMTRKQIDELCLRDMLLCEGSTSIGSFFIEKAVRLFGWTKWE